MKHAGFTLIELIIALLIIALLALIAVPSYKNHIVSAKLSEAYNTLSTYRVQLEQSYQDSGNYGTTACNVNVPSGTYFTYSCAVTNNGQGFTATATGNAVQDLNGYTFTIDDAGNRRTTQFPSGAVPAACWLHQAGDC